MNTGIMNDVLFAALFLLALAFLCVGVPLFLIFSVISCVAYSKTKAWKKEKAKRAAQVEGDVEMDPLVSEDEEEEPLDSEDDAEITARKEEQNQDWNLTAYQKWKKEMKKQWSGAAQRELTKKKEREDRAKIAKEVAREMLRAQRRQERKKNSRGGKAQEAEEDASAQPEQEQGLPTYDVATASSS
jgi:hypothetical protein